MRSPRIRELVRGFGLNPRKLSQYAFAIGSLLVAPAALVATCVTGLTPSAGHRIVLISIAASIIGGIGSLRGAGLGGLILGLAEASLCGALDGLERGVAFLILFCFILARPFGAVWHPGEGLMRGYIVNLLILVSISGILAVSLNFILGYAGIFSMAHAAFFGIAAYTGALVAMHVSTSLLVAIPLAMVICAALSLVISLPSLRVRGDYFVVASLGLQMIAFTVFIRMEGCHRRHRRHNRRSGRDAVRLPSSAQLEFFFAVVAHLPRACRACDLRAGAHELRPEPEGDPRQRGGGRDLRQESDHHQDHRRRDLHGALRRGGRALRLPYLVREPRELHGRCTSVLLMAMIIIGGTGTVFGPILGALIIHLLPAGLTYLTFLPARDLASMQQIIYGGAMVLLMIYRPSAAVGRPTSRTRGRNERRRRHPVLRLKGVNKRFGGVVAANDVDLDLPPGIITTLVGPNGAGKTTLFNLITGNLKPDSGEIDVARAVARLRHRVRKSRRAASHARSRICACSSR